MATRKVNKHTLTGGFQPRNTLHDRPSASSSSPTTTHTTARLALADEDDDNNRHNSDRLKRKHSAHDPSSNQRPKRGGLISQTKKRPFPGGGDDGRVSMKLPRRERHTPSPDPVTAVNILNEAAALSPELPVMERKPRGVVTSRSFKSRDHFHPATEAIDDDSDDELANSAVFVSRPTNRSRTSKLSADIQTTNFTTPRWRVAISRAACGNHTYDASELDPSQQIYLNPIQGGTLVPVDQSFERIGGVPYLKIIVAMVKKVSASSAPSPVGIHRAAGREGGADLFLELSTEDDHKRFMAWIGDRIKQIKEKIPIQVDSKSSEHMTKVFEKCFAESRARSGLKEPQEPVNDLHYLEAKEAFRDARQKQKDATSLNNAKSSTSTSKPRLKNSMKSDAPDFLPLDDDDQTENSFKRATRSVTATAPLRLQSDPKRWIDDNPSWKDIWDDHPLIYPPTGRNSAQVTMEDIPRLEAGELFNDNLIVFYSRHLQIELEKSKTVDSQRIYVMNPWFYEKLTQKKGRGINYEAVKSWTAKVDLFKFDYVVVPVNEHTHWYLAIICYPGKLLPQAAEEVVTMDVDSPPPTPLLDLAAKSPSPPPQDSVAPNTEDILLTIKSDIASEKADRSAKASLPRNQQAGKQKNLSDASEPRVITFDSLGGPHSPTCTNLREYLVQEAKNRRHVDIEPPARFGFTAKGIPEQGDFSSCGAYLLGYMEEFFKNPDKAVQQIILKQDMNWQIDAKTIRDKIRNLAITLRREQNARRDNELKEKEAKKRAKADKLAKIKGADEPSPAAQQTPGTNNPADAQEPASDRPSSGFPSGTEIPRAATEDETRKVESDFEESTESVQEVHAVISCPEGRPANATQESLACVVDTTTNAGSPPANGNADDGQQPASFLKRLPSSPLDRFEGRHSRDLLRTPDRELYQGMLSSDSDGFPSGECEACSPKDLAQQTNTEEDVDESSETYYTASETTPVPRPEEPHPTTPPRNQPRRSNKNNPIEITDDSPIQASSPQGRVTSAFFTIDIPAMRRSPRQQKDRTPTWEKPSRIAKPDTNEVIRLEGNEYRFERRQRTPRTPRTVDLTEDD